MAPLNLDVMCIQANSVVKFWIYSLVLLCANSFASDEPPFGDYDQIVHEARLSGNVDGYRAALLQFAAMREVMSRSEDSGSDTFSKAFLSDAMVAYIKLSNLENGLDRKGESERYMKRAEAICEVVRKSCARETLIEYVSKIDEIDVKRGTQW